MPSWIVHLATATQISKQINVDKNSFLVGNLIPDAERYVINNFSIYVPYHISHYSDFQTIDGKIEELPNIQNFINNYKPYLYNPMVLGYLTHLLTDYYWNRTTYFRYTVRDKEGNCIGVNLNNGSKIDCTISERSHIKHEDFSIFEDYISKTQDFEIPKYEEKLLDDIKLIKEIPFNKEDINKIIEYLNGKSYNEIEVKEYKLFTQEQIEKDYKDSINFVIDYLKQNVLKKKK